MMDTGSTVSILGNNCHNYFIDVLGLKRQTNDSKSLMAAGGQVLQSKGYIDLPITFQKKFHLIRAHIVPSVQIPLLLGIDFWQKFEIFPKNLNSILLISPQTAINNTSLSEKTPDHLKSYSNLSESERTTADNIISQFKEISSKKLGLGKTSLITHSIDTGDAQPLRQRYYRMSPEKQRILSSELDKMLALGVVETCESPWSSPVLLTPKKDGSHRFCLDSRKLNSVTKKDAYNLPYVAEILDNLKDAKFLSSIDLYKSFWQIPLKACDRYKTAFYIPTRGTFMFKTTPFGLTNGPATQQRLVDSLFCGPEFEGKVFAFLDDIIINSSTFSSHISLLLRVLEKLKTANLTINLEKSNFFRSELKYLGYVVNSNGLHVDPVKVEAILNYPAPTTSKEVKRFLGTASWYRRFVPNFSSLAGPLNKLTSTSKKAPSFAWTSECENSFNKLKEILISAPVLSCPNYSLPFEVHTDASNYGIGALLSQTTDGVEHPVAYMSKSLSSQERNYSITERETLAVIVALEHWRCYLENGQTFKVYTDHAALKWFIKLQNPTGRLARWGIRLSSFNFEIMHRKGIDNVIPDALSRAFPVACINNSTDDTWFRKIYNGCQQNPGTFPNYTIKNNKLFRFMKSACTLLAEFEWKQVIPSESRDAIVLENHSNATAGHLGIYKTYKRLCLNYYWPGMHKDVVRLVSSCDTCMAHKHANHATLGEMGRPKVCSRPFQMLSIDIVGPLPTTRKQNSYIFVVSCCFSKYTLLFPIRRATADVIIKLLEDNVFLIHGIPQCIILDNGTQFISNAIKNLFSKYKIPKIHYTAKYTPQVNTVERQNKSIVTIISTYIENDHRAWDLLIPKVQFALNTSVSEVTGYTPAFLVFGRELLACGSHYLNPDVEEVIFQPRDSYAENLGILSPIFDKVQSLLLQAHSRNTKYYNLRRKSAEFEVGDIVWRKTYYQSDKDKYFSKKLAPKYIKCRIIEKRSPLIYELEDMNHNHLGVWHIKDIKLTNYKE